ncbi:MAG: ANTAR domain-containing protein [Lachnospiraceae bacterium]|nr:ANTAR domain-containing protein [Lachnospiraceae bacterium]
MAVVHNKSNVLIAASTENACKVLAQVLANQFSRISFASSMTSAQQKIMQGGVDLLIINTPLPDEFGVQSAINLSRTNPGLSIMLIVKAENYGQVVYQTRGMGIFVITKPLKKDLFYEGVCMLDAMHLTIQNYAAENARLKRRLGDMGLVTRAKCLLIEKRHMSEEDAHRYIEKEAMDYSLTKAEVARNIIDSMT